MHCEIAAGFWQEALLKKRELPAFPFLASPVGCLAFGFEPCFDEGDGAAIGGNAVRRREVGTVSGFGDRKVRAFGGDAFDFEVRGVVTDVHAEPMRLIADFNGNTAPLDAESFDVAVHAARGLDDADGDFQETKTQRRELGSSQFPGFGNGVAPR